MDLNAIGIGAVLGAILVYRHISFPLTPQSL